MASDLEVMVSGLAMMASVLAVIWEQLNKPFVGPVTVFNAIIGIASVAWLLRLFRMKFVQPKVDFPDVEIVVDSIVKPNWKIRVPTGGATPPPAREKIIAFVGEFNAGKTFCINQLFNMNLYSEGRTLRTEAITMSRLKDHKVLIIDTAGVHTPVCLVSAPAPSPAGSSPVAAPSAPVAAPPSSAPPAESSSHASSPASSKDQDSKKKANSKSKPKKANSAPPPPPPAEASVQPPTPVEATILDKRATETLLRDTTFLLADAVVVVISHSTFPILHHIAQLRQLNKPLYIIHNFKDAHPTELEKLAEMEIVNVLQATQQPNAPTLIYHTEETARGDVGMYHVLLARNDTKEGRKHNSEAFDAIRDLLNQGPLPRLRDPLNDFLVHATGKGLDNRILTERREPAMKKVLGDYQPHRLEVISINEEEKVGDVNWQNLFLVQHIPPQEEGEVEPTVFHPMGMIEDFSFSQMNVPKRVDYTKNVMLFEFIVAGLPELDYIPTNDVPGFTLDVQKAGYEFKLYVSATDTSLLGGSQKHGSTKLTGLKTERGVIPTGDFVYFCNFLRDGCLYVVLGYRPGHHRTWTPEVLTSLQQFFQDGALAGVKEVKTLEEWFKLVETAVGSSVPVKVLPQPRDTLTS